MRITKHNNSIIGRGTYVLNSKSVRCTCKQLKPYGRYNNSNMYCKVDCIVQNRNALNRQPSIKMNNCGVEQPPNLDLGSEVVSL